jgi:hypothetical protein
MAQSPVHKQQMLTSFKTLMALPMVRAELTKSITASTPPLQTLFIRILMYSS